MKAPGRRFAPPVDEAMAFTARRIQEIRARTARPGRDLWRRIANHGEGYLLGSLPGFRGHEAYRLNGRLCMVSAGTAYKLASGSTGGPNSWRTFRNAGAAGWGANSPNAPPSPPITSGAAGQRRTAIVADPRMTPTRARGSVSAAAAGHRSRAVPVDVARHPARRPRRPMFMTRTQLDRAAVLRRSVGIR